MVALTWLWFTAIPYLYLGLRHLAFSDWRTTDATSAASRLRQRHSYYSGAGDYWRTFGCVTGAFHEAQNG
jgi:hypothetical protein